jgi:hypothetical protein
MMKLKPTLQVSKNSDLKFCFSAHANGTIRMYNTLTGKVMAQSNYASMPQGMSDESTVACIRYRPSTILQQSMGGDVEKKVVT